MNKLVIGVSLSVILVVVIMYFMMKIEYVNKEVSLRTQAVACQKANEARYDEVWKVIKQVANVTDKYSKDFKEIYLGMMEGRYSGEGKNSPLFKMVSEQNPQLESAMYTKISDTIIAQRAGFTRDQKKLIDIKREHDLLRMSIPSKWFVGDRPEIEIVIVTSDKTSEAFKTGKDNDIQLF